MENLRKIREQRHLTQVRVSVDIGVSQEAISAYEGGKSSPSVDMLCCLADYFHTSTDFLLDRTDNPFMVCDLLMDVQEEDRELLNCFRHLNQKKKYQLIAMAIELGREP